MAPKGAKRKSSGSSPGLDVPKTPKTKGCDPDSWTPPGTSLMGALPWCKPSMDWFHACVTPAGGIEKVMTANFGAEETWKDFCLWMDASFPCPPDVQYGTNADLDAPGGGPLLLRPYMLHWRHDLGLKGLIDDDVGFVLFQMVLAEGFKTNADLPGVEKLSGNRIRDVFLESQHTPMDFFPENGEILCGGLGFQKGWTRSIICMLVLACFKMNNLVDLLSDDFKGHHLCDSGRLL
ncbi:unnamed protein product [Polarella glacialis]|uniref:Uncharacterized protein n=1 Tax=Polarella glacialis TaxID=89957 RepID=A0A813I1D7_POLGL|nr:unnamed protein product [Polarella glacialis]